MPSACQLRGHCVSSLVLWLGLLVLLFDSTVTLCIFQLLVSEVLKAYSCPCTIGSSVLLIFFFLVWFRFASINQGSEQSILISSSFYCDGGSLHMHLVLSRPI